MNRSRDQSGGNDRQTRVDAARKDADSRAETDAGERLGRVEAEIAFQGDALRELSDALGAQQVDVLTLQRQVHLLGEQLAALRADVARAEPDSGDDEPPPPHY